MTENSIILVDDDPGARETLGDVLSEWGYKSLGFEKGQDAIRAFEKDPVNVLLLDIKLPDISGIQVLQQAREINPDVAVVIMTGHANLENAVSALNQGASAYITKPINMQELKALLHKVFREVHLSQENKRLIDHLQLANRDLEMAKRELERTNSNLTSLTQEMEDLLRIVSHDLKSPLINIQGFASRLEEEIKSQERPNSDAIFQSIQFIKKGTTRMDAMIQSLLRLSRVGRKADPFEENDLSGVLSEVRDVFSHQLKQRGIEFSCEPLPKVWCRRNEMCQVFSNLVGNAIAYMGEKTPRKIDVKCLALEHQYQFSVSDTGIGIEEKNFENIFRVFSRVGEINTPGEGMGLAIVRKIVSGHGGKIWVESKKGVGSTFFFILPKGGKDAATG